MASLLQELTLEERNLLKSRGQRRVCQPGELLFREGDEADNIYFIERGHISIFIEKFNSKEEIQVLGPGDCFGEMAVFNKDRRTASASSVEASEITALPTRDFLDVLAAEPNIDRRIRDLLNARNEELVLKEKLIDATGMRGKHLHIGIKGDPSLRESAMSRERYESVVDKVLADLVPRLEDMLLNRCVYQIFIGFNNGEIRVSNIFDPFSEEYHPAIRLIDEAYVDRHFPKMDFDDKVAMIREVYGLIHASRSFAGLPSHLGQGFGKYFQHWQPVEREQIARTISQLPQLRSIPNFYVRNFTVSIVKDAIHMQFNCDGAHIVSTSGYERFLAENL